MTSCAVIESLCFLSWCLSFLIAPSLSRCPRYPTFNWDELSSRCVHARWRTVDCEVTDQRLNTVSLLLITCVLFFLSFRNMKDVTVGRLWGLKYLVSVWFHCLAREQAMKAKALYYIHKTWLSRISVPFSFLFPPSSKSFILLQGPINPIHILSPFVAPWKMDLYNQ